MQGMKAIAAHAKFWEESKYMSKFPAPEGKCSEFWLLGYSLWLLYSGVLGVRVYMLLEFWRFFWSEVI